VENQWDDAAEQQSLGKQPRGSGRLIGLFLLLAVVMTIVLVVKSFTPPSDPTASPAVGQVFDQLHFEPLTDDAQPISFDDVQGQVTLINFWGPWCGPCRIEFPELVELRNDLADPRFRFISASYSHAPGDPQLRQQTAAFLKSQQFVLPVHQDPQFAAAQSLLKLSGDQNFSFPTTVLLDQQGVIRSIWVGYRPGIAKEMRQRVDELLK
jgi:cytochrome c biogenesis protein CcmG/thiol:disulfide interchange protein DsbE